LAEATEVRRRQADRKLELLAVKEQQAVANRNRVLLANRRAAVGISGARQSAFRASKESGQQTREEAEMWRQQVLDERELHAVTHARPVTDQLHDLRLEVTQHARQRVEDTRYEIGQQVRAASYDRHAEVYEDRDTLQQTRRDRAEYARREAAEAVGGSFDQLYSERSHAAQAMRQAAAERRAERAAFKQSLAEQHRAARDVIEVNYGTERIRQIRQAELDRKADLAAEHMAQLNDLAVQRQHLLREEERRKFAQHDAVYLSRYTE